MPASREAAMTAMSKGAKILILGATVTVGVLAAAIGVIACGSQSTSRAGGTPAQKRAASRGIAQAKEIEGEIRAMKDANAEGLSYTPLPPLDAEGYIEGPVEYTDHGLRIHLNTEQASNPVEETEGDLYLQVRPKTYTRRPAVQSSQETQEMSDSELRDKADSVLTIHLKTNEFGNPSDSNCTSQEIPEAARVKAQICTLGSVSGAEVLDEHANLLATQIEGNPATMYREMVEVLPALAAEPSETTPTTQTESTGTTSTTSTAEASTEQPSSSSACGTISLPQAESRPLKVTVVKGEVSCPEARRVLQALYVGNRGRPHCDQGGEVCDRASTYYVIDGWKCGTGAGGGGCSKGNQNQVEGDFRAP
jgi:hypothetical protein